MLAALAAQPAVMDPRGGRSRGGLLGDAVGEIWIFMKISWSDPNEHPFGVIIHEEGSINHPFTGWCWRTNKPTHSMYGIFTYIPVVC